MTRSSVSLDKMMIDKHDMLGDPLLVSAHNVAAVRITSLHKVNDTK